jgi:hypothetical protein
VTAITTASPAERQWYIASRWQEFEGETRANVLRLVAIGAFYLVQLVHFYGFSDRGATELLFHQRATAIAVAWTMVALAVMLCLRRQVFPAALKFASTAGDLALLTSLTALAAGPHSPLVLAYFVLIAVAGVRFSLGLVWFAALGAMICYWLLVGIADGRDSRWFDGQHAVPPVEQLMTLLSLGLTGVVVGQMVRRVKGLAADYSERIAAADKGRAA